MAWKPFAALTFAVTLAVASSAQAEVKRSFFSGYAGSLPTATHDLAGDYFQKPAVRSVIYALEKGPLSRAEAERLLANSDVSVDDLVRLKLVRADPRRLRLGFAYFTAADMALVHAVAAKHVPSLVAAYRADAPRFEAIWRGYSNPTVDRKQLAFDMIAGVALNWDALDLLDEGGWRKAVLVQGPGWQYGFWASEDKPGYDYKGYFWGSSSFPADAFNFKDAPLDYTFSSFGDPFSDPRMNFPDLLYLPADQLSAPVRAAAAPLGFRDDNSFGLGLKGVLGLELSRDVGPLLFALRAGPKTEAELAALVPAVAPARLGQELSLLQAIGYVTPGEGDRWALRVPVLDHQDAPMVAATLIENRRILHAWLARNYPAMRRELTGLTAVRQGVPYPALFTQIWHELFGLATRDLVAEGMLADPTAAGNPAPGSLSMLWRTSIYHHRWR